ncbi:hypothetical protein GMA5_3 [Gordonia phage GMA5]|uniref:Uncharacterized protein n=1 Tax=Gordonia phage GMA5 TaxID=1647472 RepID=A0A0K0MWM3_9CAUD|nr:hypothetical protein BH786_gp03 [Gordonia phage GMA5]AKI28617.1 hypothetical protein GMA5_3 [Gordonia phage GMA5]
MSQRKPNTKRYVVDATEYSAVVRCTMCPWRGFSHSKSVAYRQVATHLDRVHHDYRASHDARRRAG